MISFIGNIDAKVDAKGRVFVPAQFRRQMEGETELVLRKNLFSNSLVLYPKESWNDMMSTLRGKLNRFNREHDAIFRQFVAESERLEMDEQGRILIPKKYLQNAEIESSVRFVGNDSTIEIWASGKVEQTFVDDDSFAGKLEDIFNQGL